MIPYETAPSKLPSLVVSEKAEEYRNGHFVDLNHHVSSNRTIIICMFNLASVSRQDKVLEIIRLNLIAEQNRSLARYPCEIVLSL